MQRVPLHGGGEQADLSPKQVKAAAKKEQDSARMLQMGVPEALLRRIEAGGCVQVEMQFTHSA
jgi:hypothetical protein